MNILKIGFITLFLLFACRMAMAEWFDGEVRKVDAQAGTLTISEIDPITDTEEKEEILVTGETVFEGVGSLKDIRTNDSITVEAQYDESADVWKAVSIEVAEAGA